MVTHITHKLYFSRTWYCAQYEIVYIFSKKQQKT